MSSSATHCNCWYCWCESAVLTHERLVISEHLLSYWRTRILLLNLKNCLTSSSIISYVPRMSASTPWCLSCSLVASYLVQSDGELNSSVWSRCCLDCSQATESWRVVQISTLRLPYSFLELQFCLRDFRHLSLAQVDSQKDSPPWASFHSIACRLTSSLWGLFSPPPHRAWWSFFAQMIV